MWYLVPVGIFVGMFWLILHGVRRFAAEQRRLGRWDEQGPLVETEAPPESGAVMWGHGMNERLEVDGQWHGAVIRDRRRKGAHSDPSPNAKPHSQ